MFGGCGGCRRLGLGRLDRQSTGRHSQTDDIFEEEIIFAAALFFAPVSRTDRLRNDQHRLRLAASCAAALRFRFPLGDVTVMLGDVLDVGRIDSVTVELSWREPCRAHHFAVDVQRTQTGAAGQGRTVFFVEMTRLQQFNQILIVNSMQLVMQSLIIIRKVHEKCVASY